MTSRRLLTAALAAAGVVAAGVTTPASAATLQQSTLASCKQVGQTEVSRRLTTISTLQTRVGNAKDLTAAHRSRLSTLLSSDSTGLSALNATIQADTTLAQCRTDVRAVVTKYRIYVLVVPQVHLVIAADILTTVDTRLANLEDKLAKAIDSAGLPPGQKDKAGDALADMRSQVSAAATALQGQADAVLALTPAGYPGTTSTLLAVRSRLSTARTDLGKARDDVETIRDILEHH